MILPPWRRGSSCGRHSEPGCIIYKGIYVYTYTYTYIYIYVYAYIYIYIYQFRLIYGNKFRAWRSMSTAPMYTMHSRPSRAQAVAVATPCCPAPVSAMMRFLPRCLASSAWPSELLILCAPVWASSSRLNQSCAPPSFSVMFLALVVLVSAFRFRTVSVSPQHRAVKEHAWMFPRT